MVRGSGARTALIRRGGSHVDCASLHPSEVEPLPGSSPSEAAQFLRECGEPMLTLWRASHSLAALIVHSRGLALQKALLMSTSNTPAAPAGATGKHHQAQDSIFLFSYPKIIFLYPAYFVAIAAGIWTWIERGDINSSGHTIASWTFLTTLSLNLVVLSFDFPRTTSITLFFFIVVVILALSLTSVYMPNLLPGLGALLVAIRPTANHAFFFLFSGVMTLIYLCVWLHSRFDYWEVRSNELLHHHGFMSDLERFPAPQLKIDKEVNDIFEYILLGAGRLILHPSNERRAIVLENVIRISRKEQAITKLLGAMQVRVRKDDDE